MLLLLLLAVLLPAPARAETCDAVALARPAAAPALAFGSSSLVRSCGGFNGGTFSARVLNPNNNDIGVYLGVGAAQCGASCVQAQILSYANVRLYA